MEHVRLGRTGLQVSRICLGMMSYGDPGWRDWLLDEEAARPFVRRAAAAGITFFDTADAYSLGVSEEITGRLLAETFADRDDYVLATKVFMPMKTSGDGQPAPNSWGLSRKHIMASIDGSLRRLGTDHVDLYQIHRWDPHTPIEETMEALHDVVKAGKARYIGASSMDTWQFVTAQATADAGGWTRFASMQHHHNLLYREEEREMEPYCAATGVGMLPWSPLARGALARARDGEATSRSRSDTFADLLYADAEGAVIDAVGRIADRRGVSRATVALAWVLSRPAITAPIVGATKVSHIDDAVAAVDLRLDDEEVAALESPYRPRAVVR